MKHHFAYFVLVFWSTLVQLGCERNIVDDFSQSELSEMFSGGETLTWDKEIFGRSDSTQLRNFVSDGIVFPSKIERWKQEDFDFSLERIKILEQADEMFPTSMVRLNGKEVLKEDKYDVDGKVRLNFLLRDNETSEIEYRLYVLSAPNAYRFSFTADTREKLAVPKIRELLGSIE